MRKKFSVMVVAVLVIMFMMGNIGGNVEAQEIGNPEEIMINVSTGYDLLDTFGNYLVVDNYEVNNGKVTVEKSDMHRIGVLCQFGYSINRAVINGKEVKCIKEDGGWYYYDVEDAQSYDVKLYAGSNTYTVAWMDSGALGEDAKVEHGHVEIEPSEGITDMKQENGGLFEIKPGTMVTIRLIPDYGYQLKSTDLNGITVAAGADISTFTFKMPETNLHLAALFEKTDDQMDCTASNIVDDVIVKNGQNAVSSGNIKVTVEDNNNYDKDVLESINAKSATKIASVDITLDNIIGKGDGNYWEKNISEFDKSVSVSLKLDSKELSDGETYSVVRDHNGVLTELDTKYTASEGTITFETDRFSTYTIIKKSSEKGNSGENNQEYVDPDKSESSTKADNISESSNISDKTIMKSSQSETPQTSDSSVAGLWGIVAMISGVGVLIFKRKA